MTRVMQTMALVEWSGSPAQLAVLVSLAVITADVCRRFIRNRAKKNGYPLPPGPTPLPFVGNALSINPKEPWMKYTEWRAKYGDVMYIRLLDTDVVVLNSPPAAMELLGKRSQIYSDRPIIETVEPYGHDYDFAFSRYGDHWKLCRRIFQETFRADPALSFRPMQLCRARQMILNIINDPDNYPSHYATFSAAVAMSSVYDYEPKVVNDPVVADFDRFLELSIPALTSEKAVLLKIFPFLLRIPDWLPGSSLRREAQEATRFRDQATNIAYQYVQTRMESKDNINASMVSDHITRMKALDEPYRSEYETALKHASVTAFIGSTETTSSAITTFTLAMVKNPHVWKRAQEEIDLVLGLEKLPEFDDRLSLPYVDAILRETYRWKPVAPLGVPHANTSSDIYEGFYIPKGATIISNIWGMFYDEACYPSPELFRPERFLDAQGSLIKDDPGDLVFGFGRRACPGRHTADASVWSALATMLATLEFNPAKDDNDNDVAFEAEWVGGATLRPVKFPCYLAPRAHITKAVLERVIAQ